MCRGDEQTFSKENMQMANWHMKRCSTSLFVREMKSTLQWDDTPVRMTIIQSQEMRSVEEDVEERKPLCTVGGNVNWCSLYGKEYGDSFKKIKDTTTIWSIISTSEYLSEEYRNTNSKKHVQPHIYCNIIYNSQNMAKCPYAHTHTHTHGLPRCFSGKESTCLAGDRGWIPGSGRSPGGGHGNPSQYSCLGNSKKRRAWQATVHRVTKKLDTT